MAIYAQRVRQHMTALGVASAVSAQLGARTAAAGVEGSGMPLANGASGAILPAGTLLRTTSRSTTTGRDAFAGIFPGPCTSTSPPV